MFIKADTDLGPIRVQVDLVVQLCSACHVCFPVSLYVSLPVPLSLCSPSSLGKHWFHQGRKWNCVALWLPAGEGDTGRERGRGSLSKKSQTQVFLEGMRWLIVWGCEGELRWVWLGAEKVEEGHDDTETWKYFHRGIWLTWINFQLINHKAETFDSLKSTK